MQKKKFISCQIVLNLSQQCNIYLALILLISVFGLSSLHLLSKKHLKQSFLSRVSTLTRDIDIAILSVHLSVRPSVRDGPVSKRLNISS